jgi:hypothetical protein
MCFWLVVARGLRSLFRFRLGPGLMGRQNAITGLRLPFGDPGIELDDMKGLAAWAVRIGRIAVFFWVVTRMDTAFAVEMKPDS